VLLRQLWLADFRSYTNLDVEFSNGLTAIVGSNGQGKTNLLEAIGYLATLSSFRGAPAEALVRQGAGSATVRAEVEREGRELLIEAELGGKGRNRIQVNRQRLPRARDLLGALRVSVFSPDDRPSGAAIWMTH
jgi:DNA replication and repair protein RecF